MDLLSEYKELYYKEIEHSERLNNKIPTSITFLSIAGTGIIFLGREAFPFLCRLSNIAFMMFLVMSVALFAVSLVKFYIAYTNYSYNYFPINDAKSRVDEGQRLIQSTRDDNTEKEVYKNICQKFADAFISAAIHNRVENARKSKNHNSFIMWVFATLISVFIAFFIWALFINPYHLI